MLITIFLIEVGYFSIFFKVNKLNEYIYKRNWDFKVKTEFKYVSINLIKNMEITILNYV